jgi:hypothetical protein
MRAAAAILAAVAAACALFAPARPADAPLWPGSAFTARDRDAAVVRGLQYLGSAARDPAVFSDYGPDLTGAFYLIATTSARARLRALAWDLGRERAAEWRRLYPAMPADASPEGVFGLLSGADAAERFGFPDPAFRRAVAAAARRFTAVEFHDWDPVREPPPADVPEPCGRCGRSSPRGATRCDRCAQPLAIRSRHDVWMDALILAYTGDQYGVTLGCSWKDVVRWLPRLRPYPRKGSVPDHYHDDALYAVTHLIYTYNGYGAHRVSRDCLPDEFAYLRENLQQSLAEGDAETLGEMLDTLRAFGLGLSDPGIRAGFDFLLRQQNSDGSWGSTAEPDPYVRYHTTWTAVDGLREYRWSRVLPCLEP